MPSIDRPFQFGPDPPIVPEEPERNISGGDRGGGAEATILTGDAATRAEAVVDALGEAYWTKTYGGRDAFECLVRTILSQNTSDAASQPAHDALVERYGTTADGAAVKDVDGDAGLASALARAEHDDLASTIESAGLYNRKARVIRDVADWVLTDYGSAAAFDEYVREAPYDEVRETLLSVDGVGPKTADCVLLFAGGRDGVFPVDTHVHRIARRLGLAPADADHEGVRAALEAAVPAEKCGFGHTATIQFGREYCTARDPACLDGPDACPLGDLCDRVGVDPATGTVRDPRDAVEV